MRSVREISLPKPRSPRRNRSCASSRAENAGRQSRRNAASDAAQLRNDHRAIRWHGNKTICQCRVDDSGGNRLAITGNAARPLSQISTLRLSLPVPESLVPTIRVGQPVEVQVKSLGRSFARTCRPFRGKVDPSTRTMITEVDVPNPTGVILPGMYAEVALAAKQHEDVLAAPSEPSSGPAPPRACYAVDKAGSDSHRFRAAWSRGCAASRDRFRPAGRSDLVITGRRAGLNAGDKVKPKLMDSGQ